METFKEKVLRSLTRQISRLFNRDIKEDDLLAFIEKYPELGKEKEAEQNG